MNISRKLRFGTATIAALAASLTLWGCDQMTEPRPLTLEPAVVSYAELSSTEFTLVEGGSGYASTVSGTFGYWGGRLTQDGHQLIVPEGAVTEPTEFRMTLWANGYVGVDLSAIRVTESGDTINVGAQGFGAPVALTLSYRRAKTSGKEENQLRVVRLADDGSETVEWKYSHVDKRGKKVNTSLDRFSDYGLAWPW